MVPYLIKLTLRTHGGFIRTNQGPVGTGSGSSGCICFPRQIPSAEGGGEGASREGELYHIDDEGQQGNAGDVQKVPMG
jgi:hypothetical protein